MPLLSLIVAAALDLALGDPPNRLHPVAWMGRAIGAGRRWLCHGGPPRLFVGGALVTLTVVGVAAGAGAAVAALAGRLGPAGPLVEGAALSLLLSVRGLIRAGQAVARPLAAGDLDAARAAVCLHLVSRPTATLGPDEVASATIESLAENLTEAVIAPVCFYLLFGLAGAAAYRAVNTADAMLGYHDGALEWFGKLAARLDDALNFVPARLAALGLLAGAAAAGEDARGALRMLRRDGALTASPNAGRTMAAIADALAKNFPAMPEVARVEVAGPGFLNVFLAPAWTAGALHAILAAGAAYGQSASHGRQRTRLEFVSANPTGPLVIVNARAAAVGDSLARLLRSQGASDTTEFYVLDTSTQFEALALSFASSVLL